MFTLKTFYKSKQWESFRNRLINERYDENGYIICADCGKPIVRRYDIIAHHIEELTEDNVNDVTVSLNPDNIKLICFNCHNKEHERFGFHKQLPKAERHVYIVYSPLCFKALEYVEGVATINDLVVDINNLYEMITINDRYVKPDAVRSTVFGLRDYLYDMVKYRNGKWVNAYIVTTTPRHTDRQRLIDRVNADELIPVLFTYEQCMELIQGEHVKEWTTYINKWFESYTADE